MTPSDLERFRKILGLLGSDQDGERSAAALKASAILAANGLTWADVTVPAMSSPQPVAGPGDIRRSKPAKPWPQQFSEAQEMGRRAQRADREARRARWDANRSQPDADGFYGDPGVRKP